MQSTSPNELIASTNRPEGQRDRAPPLSYGDLILLSCQFDEGVGYLCEHGCVMKKCNDIEMDSSSRELVFEVCTAADNRALVEYTTYVRKHGYRAADMHLRQLEDQKMLEEKSNELQAVHMVGRTVSYGDIIQLRQPKSHGFLGVDIGQAPRQEATAKRVVLHTSRGRPVAFRIMPRFKYLVEGHTVCNGDRIALVSTEFPGEYVHAHMGFESIPSVGVVHEVHLAAPSIKNPVTAWVVDSFFPHAMQSAQHVKAGDVVRLYHSYHAAYVAVQTGDATVFLESSQSALASTMWVICDQDPLTGGLVRMQHSYSFMHLVTRKFLVVKDLDKLMPQLKMQDPSGASDSSQTLFAAVEVNSDKNTDALMTLQPLEDDSKEQHLPWGGRVRLVHTQSSHYMHSMSRHQLKSPIRLLPQDERDELMRRRGVTQLGQGAEGQALAGPHVHVPERLLVASPALFREDSFDIVKVPHEQVRAVDALGNCLPVLESYLVQLQDDLEAHREREENEEAHRQQELQADQQLRDPTRPSAPLAPAPLLLFPDEGILDVIEKLTELQVYVYTSGYVNNVSSEERSRGEAAAGGAQAHGSLAQPLDYCQNFMRDLGVAELLFGILVQSFIILDLQAHQRDMQEEDAKLRAQKLALDNGASMNSFRSVVSASGSASGSVLRDAAQTPSQQNKREMEKKLKEMIKQPHNRTGRLVWQLCYSVLYHMVHKHKDNAHYLARYMALIQQQLFLELGAEKLLLEMLADNETLLNAMATDATKEEHVHFHRKALIEGGKNAMHLRFLTAMCGCADRGISRHQDLVLPYLLSNQRKMLLDVTVVHQTLKLRDWYYDLSDLPEDAQDLGQLCSGSLRQTEKGAKQKRMLDYFVESLLLLATLCKPDSSGRRDFVVHQVRHFLDIHQCKSCLENELLPEHLRRNMCEFVRVVYVQDDSFNKVTRLQGVCIWSDLEAQEKLPAAARSSTRASSVTASDAKADTDAHSQDTEAVTDNWPQEFKNIIREYLSQNACQYYPGRTPHSNPLKLSMIRLCRELVLYGHYLESELVAVVKEGCIILDFSSMRFADEHKGEGLGLMTASKASSKPSSDTTQGTLQGVLTEHTVSLALQHLRPLCKNIAPIEMARFRSAFKCCVYEAGDLIVESGENAADMYVIQSGAAFMLQTADGVDSVVDTVGPGDVWGVDTLSRDKKTWPWRVRCSQPVTALQFSAQALYNVSSEMARTGRMTMTDELEVVLETKREACALINDIYDLRLRVRTMKMLQEYRFDLNISQKVYTRENLTGMGDDLQASDILAHLPLKVASNLLALPKNFYMGDTAVLGGYLSKRLKPMQSFVGCIRIDRAVLVLALLQYMLAALIMVLMALRVKTLLEEQPTPGPSLTADGEAGRVAPASASLGMHPGLSSTVTALGINLALTWIWSMTQLGVAWSAVSHARSGKEVTLANSEGDKFVQYMTNPLGAKVGFMAQFSYLLFWVVNTAVGLVVGLIGLGNGAPDASSAVLTQALWLVLGTGIGLYNGLAFVSLYVHLQRPALFLQETAQEEEQGVEAEVVMPRREFLKILEYLDLDENGGLSQTLADLIISPYKPLVVDAFNLLVRTHDSHKELHGQLVNMLILDSGADIADPKRLMYISDELTKALLGVTNAMQAYVVERSNEQMRLKEKKSHAQEQAALQTLVKSSSELTAKQRELEAQRNQELARLRKEREELEKRNTQTQISHIKEVEPLLKQLLTMMDDKVRTREKVQRRLLQRKGMHWLVLRLLACLPADFTETTGPLCYRALARLCDGAPNIQAELAQHLDVFLAHLDSIPLEVALVLSAIYKDNVDLCYSVEEYMMKKLVWLMKDDLAAPYLMLAKIMITPKDQIVRRNQNLIIKHLDAHEVQLLLFQGGAKALRKACLTEASPETIDGASPAPVSRGKSAKATKMLQVHIGSIQLLTACMAEYNHDNKKRCRGGNPNLTMTLADIETDLYDRELPVSVKVALLDFLVQAYILVDMPNINLLMQPEIANILDQLARWIELLPVDSRGSKIARLTKSERFLLTNSYMATAKAFFSTLPASDLRQRESGRVRVGGRLLEALVELLLSCCPNGASCSDLTGEEELRILEVVMLLARSIKDSFIRYPLLVGEKVGSRLRQVLGASELTLNEDDDGDETPAPGKCYREIQLKDEMTLEQERTKHLPLTVSEGVVVFGNDFLTVMSGPGSPSNDFDTLCAAFMQAKPLPHIGVDAAKGDTGSSAAAAAAVLAAAAAAGGDDDIPVSNQHLESLVDLLTTCESLSAAMQQTGLSILGKVVKGVKFDHEGVVDGKNRREWLRAGVPKMLVHLITAASSNDSIVLECLKIGIEFLESGKRPAQDAFYKLLTSSTSEVSLFQKLRDRLVRGERGLGIYQATFMRLSQELHSQCSTLGKVLTIEGVRRLTQADRLVQSFLGSYPEQVLRFLQLLCEGHNKEMQDYMHSQGKTSVHMVSCAADFAAACSRHMHPASISMANQCVATLIEFVQNPCYPNQRALVDTQLPHVLNQFLQLTPDLPVEFADIDTYLTDISKLKRNSVTLLLSLLERVDDRFIPSRILKALEMDKILASINDLRASYLGLEPGEEPPEDDEASSGVAHESIAEHEDFEVACALFMLVRMLQYFDQDTRSGLSSKCNKNYIYDIERLEANCGFIEISRDRRLERIFFQIPPICRYLSRASKHAILRDVNRDNHQDQLLDFVERAHVRYDEMVHLQDLHRSSAYQCFLLVSDKMDVAFFFNAILINTIALLCYRYKDNEFATLETPTNIIIESPWDEIILVLSILQLIICIGRLLGYYLECGVLRVKRIFTTDDEYYKVATEQYGGPLYYKLFTKILLSDGYFLLLTFYLALNLVALALRWQTRLSMFVLMLHLVDMFNLSPSLTNVTTAVSARAATLLQTALLAFVMMYIYSAVGFVLFAEYFSFEAAEVEGGDEKDYNVNNARCDTIWKCFIVTVDMGLRKGDIGGALEDIAWRDVIPGSFIEDCDSPPGLEYMGCVGIGDGLDVGPFIGLRIIYTSTFFVFINTILINIIFGVIIDTFGDLRERNQAMEEEMEHRCFVCGLERYKFEINSTDGNGFAKHIKQDHNLWIYLYFMIYLWKKPVDDQTGFESYVFFRLNELLPDGQPQHKRAPDVSWFPNNEAMAIPDLRDANTDFLLSMRLDVLSDAAQALMREGNARMQAMQHAVEKQPHHMGPETILEDNEDESSDEEDALQNVLAAAGATAADRVGAASRGMENFIRSTRDLAQGVSALSLEPALSVRYATQLSQLADEGYDNEEVCMRLLDVHGGDIDRVLRALQHEHDDEHDEQTDLGHDGSFGHRVPQPDLTAGGATAAAGASNWV